MSEAAADNWSDAPWMTGPWRGPLKRLIDLGHDLPAIVWEAGKRHISAKLVVRTFNFIFDKCRIENHGYMFTGLENMARVVGCCERQMGEVMRELARQGLIHRERRGHGLRTYMTWPTVPGMYQPFRRSRLATAEMEKEFADGAKPATQPDSVVRLDELPDEQQWIAEAWERERRRRYPDAPRPKKWELPLGELWAELQQTLFRAAAAAQLPKELAATELMRLFLAEDGFADGKLVQKHHPLRWIGTYLSGSSAGATLKKKLFDWARQNAPAPVEVAAEPPPKPPPLPGSEFQRGLAGVLAAIEG